MDVFEEADYRRIVELSFRERPNHGRGETSRLARHLGVNPTMISQILKGKKNFTEEQACETARFLKLNSKETFHFVLLVSRERAGTESLRAIFADQIQKSRTEARSLKGRIALEKGLTFEQQAVYYSSWVYAAVHTLVSVDGFDEPTMIARKLELEAALARSVIERLVEYGLLAEKGGRLTTGVASTYLPPDSPLILRHHQNWRQMASQRMSTRVPDGFIFTAPFSMSEKDIEEFRLELVRLVEKLYKLADRTKPERLACLNIDLLRL